MVLSPDLELRLERILTEQTQRNRLQSYNLSPRRKILLVGPPGSGKTMTASALAGELHLPLLTAMYSSLIGKFMGETASRLKLIFDAMSLTRGVYFFDEFDAIGTQRNSTNDTGEIRRVLNSFLLFIENDESESLIVAATNHPNLLDEALFRRFDDVILSDKGKSESYRRPTRKIDPIALPERDRAAHAQALELSIGTAIQQARQQIDSRESGIATGAPGFYLEFQILADGAIEIASRSSCHSIDSTVQDSIKFFEDEFDENPTIPLAPKIIFRRSSP